jgi:hypothetical protein
MDTTAKEGFVDVNVAEAGDEGLVQQRRFDAAGAAGQRAVKTCRLEAPVVRLGTKLSVQGFHVVRRREADAAKLPLVSETEVMPVIEMNCQVLETDRGGIGSYEQEPAGHSEVNHEREARLKWKQEIFAAPQCADDHLAGKGVQRGDARDAGLQHLRERSKRHSVDGSSFHNRMERAANGLDFGKLWHTWQSSLGDE